MKFSDLAKYRADTKLLISARHDAWLSGNSNPTYSTEALAHAARELEKQARPRDRRGTVSASSLGSCRRRQQFTFLGMPELPPSPKTAQIFHNGTFMHIRWQMAGLTEGWLVAAEVSVPKDNDYRLNGTMDGLAYNNAVVELKSINSNGFRSIMSYGEKEQHKYQLATYLLCTGLDQGVFIYEDKDTQEYKEIVRTRDELPMAEAAESAVLTWDLIDNEKLAEPLESCMNGEGYQYAGCPFRKVCFGVGSWNEAEDLADQSRGE